MKAERRRDGVVPRGTAAPLGVACAGPESPLVQPLAAMKLALLLLALAALLAFPLSAQKTIHVPKDIFSIQLGIAIADDGDTVLVAPGWYQERIDFLGRAVTVKSEGGSSQTTIADHGVPSFPNFPQYRTVRCISGEGSGSILDGFTITGPSDEGPQYGSGGISGGGATIRNCIISGNYGHEEGAGIDGAGLVENCIIRDNHAMWRGGGVANAIQVTDCIIENNGAGGVGGGVFLQGGTLENCTIRGNATGDGWGGGVFVSNSGTLTNCVISENIASWFESFSAPKGAGVYAFGSATLQNCTVVANAAVGLASETPVGGVYGFSGLVVSNSVIWGNVAPSPQFWGAETGQVKGATVAYSCIQFGFPGLENTQSDPQFVDIEMENFHLLASSPCIDAGDPLSDPDSDGTVADMGAFPLNQYPICVDTKVPIAATVAFDHVGSSVAASPSYVIAGAPDVNGPGFESGAAFLAYRDGPAWVALPKLVASDEATGALFGFGVALDDSAAWIGAPGVVAETGAAYVFTQQPDGTWSEDAKLSALDAAPGARFGSRVAVELGLAAASAPLADAPAADSGAVYVFLNGPSGWAQQAKLVALDGAAGDQFGSGLAMSGSYLLAGALSDDHVAQNAGSAYVFHLNGSTWSQEAKLTASDASANEQFGNEVALDGDVAVVAARAADGVGAAYVFRRSGSAWTQEQKLVASTPSSNAEFGSSVTITGSRVLVGARYDDSVGSNAGAAYLFEFNGATWVQTKKYTLPGASGGDAAGSAVALSGDYVLVGSEWADDPELDSGELWAFAAPGTCLPKLTKVPGTQAQDPNQLTAMGTYLGQTQTVLINGAAVPLIAATDTSITYKPQPDDPGFLPVAATGSVGTAVSKQQLYPSLVASTTGVGGTLNLELDNGKEGAYVLAMGFGSLPTPISIASPSTWYGVMLNPGSPLFVIGPGAFAGAAPVMLAYTVPSNPALTGLALYFQAWCQQGFPGSEVTYSFTNLGQVVL